MRRTTLIAIGLAAAVVLVPTVIAVAQADPTEGPAPCPHHQTMDLGMMDQNGMGMMPQSGMGPDDCPMWDDADE